MLGGHQGKQGQHHKLGLVRAHRLELEQERELAYRQLQVLEQGQGQHTEEQLMRGPRQQTKQRRPVEGRVEN